MTLTIYDKKNLLGLTCSQIAELLPKDTPTYRSRQIFHHLYNKKRNFSAMTFLQKNTRHEFEKLFRLNTGYLSNRLHAPDHTTKIELTLFDQQKIEAVLLSQQSRRFSACLSSQAGCRLGCRFCQTAKMGFRRNLGVAEIIEQFLSLQQFSPKKIDSVIFMGMGEPLLNFENCLQSIAILTDPLAIGLSPRRITISSCGISAGIKRLADLKLKVRLAVSLHSAEQRKREHIMPVAKKESLPQLKKTLLYYQEKSGQRITIEYIPFSNFNDTPEQIDLLVNFCRHLNVMINLIPYNEVTGSCLQPVSSDRMTRCKNLLLQKGLKTVVRRSRGAKILAACGQLASQRDN